MRKRILGKTKYSYSAISNERSDNANWQRRRHQWQQSAVRERMYGRYWHPSRAVREFEDRCEQERQDLLEQFRQERMKQNDRKK